MFPNVFHLKGLRCEIDIESKSEADCFLLDELNLLRPPARMRKEEIHLEDSDTLYHQTAIYYFLLSCVHIHPSLSLSVSLSHTHKHTFKPISHIWSCVCLYEGEQVFWLLLRMGNRRWKGESQCLMDDW